MTKNPQHRAVWHRTSWAQHSTLTPELQTVKDHLLSRAREIPTYNRSALQLSIAQSQREPS